MFKQIVLASNNQGKVREIQALLPSSITLIPQSAFAISSVAETGLTFVENALIKARHAAQISQLPAIADDSGLEVDVLQGAPGIYSARYAGEEADDQKNNEKLLAALTNYSENSDRTARFQCVMVYLRHAADPAPIIAQGMWEGYILKHPRGTQGFGYDPVFFSPSYQCSAAELPLDVKNQLSHRGQALRQLLAMLPIKF